MILVAWLCFLIVHLRLAWVNLRLGILPDRLNFSGALAGFALSGIIPALQGTNSTVNALLLSVCGAIGGYLAVWGILELGKFFFGLEKLRFRQAVSFDLQVEPPEAFLRIGERDWYWADVFYRDSDRLRLKGQITVDEPEEFRMTGAEAVFSIDHLWMQGKTLDVSKLRLVTGTVTDADLPRELVGFGVVKMFFFAGAFLGPVGVLQYLGLTALAALLAGGFQAIRGRSSGNSQLPRIEVGPCGAVAALILVASKLWTSAAIS